MWIACRPAPAPPVPAPAALAIEALAVTEDPVVPLARGISLDTTRPATVVATATSDRGEVASVSGTGTHHELALLGLRFGRSWDLRVVATGDDGRSVEVEDSFDTAPLPEHFPTMTLHAREPSSELAYVLVSFNNDDLSGTWIVVLDAAAEPVWVFDARGDRLHEAHPFPAGVRMIAGSSVVERAWTGEVLGTWTASEVVDDPDARFHHEVAELDDGRLMALLDRPVPVDDLPTDYDDPTPRAADIVFDEVVTWDPERGDAERWPIPSLLDTARIGFDSLDLVEGAYDWGHGNAVAVAPELDAWLVSLRHQDTIAAVDRADGSLRWILANPDRWPADLEALRLQPVGALTWPFHGHAVQWLGDGLVLYLDNGNNRATPLTGVDPLPFEQQTSRVVLYRVDDGARTIREEWSWQPDPPLFAAAQGSAERLPGGHVLVDFSTVRVVGGVRVEELGMPFSTVRLLEVDPATGAVSWDLEVRDPGTGVPPAWYSYRAHGLDAFPP